jgi:hypothetical protein
VELATRKHSIYDQSTIASNIVSDDGQVEFTLDELEGLSELQLETLAYSNATPERYTVSTNSGSQYFAVYQHAKNPETRRLVLKARNTRNYDRNADLIQELVSLCQSTADLSGYSDWADLANSDRPIGSGGAALQFLQDLEEGVNAAFLKEQEKLSSVKFEVEKNEVLNEHGIYYLQNIVTEGEFQVESDTVTEYLKKKPPSEASLIFLKKCSASIFLSRMYQTKNRGPTIIFVWPQSLMLIPRPIIHLVRCMHLDLHPRPGKGGSFRMRTLARGHIREEDGL